MDHGEPPGARSDELPITPDHPPTDEVKTTPTKEARIGIVATLPNSATLKEHIDRAIHEELWVPEGRSGERISLATHSTSVIRVRGEATAKLLVTLAPRPGQRDRVVQAVHGLISKYANSVQGTVHALVEDEETLKLVATGRAGQV